RLIPEAQEYGTHTPEGILVLAGPGVKRGASLPAADIVDVVPTLLAAWNLPIPGEVDGKVLHEAFISPIQEERIVSGESPTIAGEGRAEGTDEVMERLRALGYL
ncbi:MAG: phosphodiesterase, partial [Anaerolineae bacterium]|nr:phosphodiesterase [Anaerolineae bacterium]NIO00377.1 phosphodiesterase [Anaerolineae bacterium]